MNIWLLLSAGPLLFFLAFAALSLALAVTGVPQSQIPAKISSYVPHCLLFVLVLMAAGTLLRPDVAMRAWKFPFSPAVVGDLFLGALVGLTLAGMYLLWLAPALEFLQRAIGDYVPAGTTVSTLSGSIGIFFIANVLLAPIVEETIYRGIAIPELSIGLGVFSAAVVSCIAFGLLHWAGGLWYMLLTGIVAGGCFAVLYVLREGILAPYIAHLVLNTVEFIYAYSSRADV
jgi:membrane protease YdiL (CAAX protease family)